jgi:hypothetical protein
MHGTLFILWLDWRIVSGLLRTESPFDDRIGEMKKSKKKKSLVRIQTN